MTILTLFLKHLAIALIAITAVALMHVAAVVSQDRLALLRASIALWWRNALSWRGLTKEVSVAPFYLPPRKREGCVHEERL